MLYAKTKQCNHRYQWFSSILKNSSVVWFTEEFFNMDLNHWYLWLHSYCCCCCCIKGSRNKSWMLHSLMGYFANHLWFNFNIFSANCHNIIPKEKILMPSYFCPGPASLVDKYSLRKSSFRGDRGSIPAEDYFSDAIDFSFRTNVWRNIQYRTGSSNLATSKKRCCRRKNLLDEKGRNLENWLHTLLRNTSNLEW